MENYKFFQNTPCEFFPCHQNCKTEDFNCLFCYCPLYALGKKCGGNFTYSENGIKDCSGCCIPHQKENYDLIIAKLGQIADLAKKP